MIRRLLQWGKAYQKPLAVLSLMSLIGYYFCLPNPLFSDPSSTVLEDRNGELLGARIASDGQWRFPHNDSIPEKFTQAIIAFEDKHFFYHFGIDPVAILRAFYLNLKERDIVSGGSTLTMQTIRLARKGQARTLWEKLIEAILATRLEFSYSKQEILALYASNAPFGGNVVGLDAAAWKYYGRSPQKLSWAESATLAVLPNSPALIHPGRNRKALQQKRDRLIQRLMANNVIDSTTAQLAQLEPLPQKPLPLPRLAPHLLDKEQIRQRHSGKSSIVKTSIDIGMQQRMERIISSHHQHLKANGIENAALVVLSVKTGEALAYVGNVSCADGSTGCAVDVITAPRSTGSILKPLLYASMIQDGKILPEALLPDIPSQFGGYNPKNYYPDYDGAVRFDRALSRSLNVPFVHALSRYSVPKLHGFLKRAGMTTLAFPPNHYGLSLILGGAEASLWDLAGIYASMARTLHYFPQYNGKYDPNGFRSATYRLEDRVFPKSYQQFEQLEASSLLSAAAIWHTFESMVEVIRPGEDSYWRRFSSSNKIAWKTGTSFGFRDAWAIGCNPEYVVGVWAGNATGEGRAGLIGIAAAAPILFDAFHALNSQVPWFEQPFDEMREIEVCKNSRMLPSPQCNATDLIWAYQKGLQTKPCPFHKQIHVDASGKWRVHDNCEQPANMKPASYFVLPPIQEIYHRQKNANYRILPPYRPDCQASLQQVGQQAMELIYPKKSSQIHIPKDLTGQKSATVFEVAHRDPNITIYWHLDGEYLGSTSDFHEKSLSPDAGVHELVLVDENGEKLMRKFHVLAVDK